MSWTEISVSLFLFRLPVVLLNVSRMLLAYEV